MPTRNNGRRSFFTQQQIEQINGTYDYLRQLHRDVLRQLRQMGRSISTDKRADALLFGVAGQIVGALQFLVAISSSAQEPVTRVVFEVSPLCNACTVPPAKTKDNPGPVVPPPDPGHLAGVPPPEPAHLAELDHLLDFANRTGRRLPRSIRHKNSPGVFSGHKKLMAALIKEQRHFREGSATPPPATEFRVSGPDCSHCGRPLKIIDDPMKS